MYQGNNTTLFARYALPQMVGLVFNSIYIIVDGIFIGNRLGRSAMAAAAVSVPLVEILIALSMALASGSGIMISDALAQDRKERARRIFNTTVGIAAIIGTLICIFGNILIHQLAILLGSLPEIHDDAVNYMRYIITFSPFQIFSFLLGGLARNDGRPKLAMFALVFGSLSNIFLDYVFMYPLNMGIAGAALATALGPIFSVMILLPHFIRKCGTLYFSKISPVWLDIRHVAILGFPSFIMEFTIGIVTFVYNGAISRYGFGEIGLAAFLIMGYLMLIILTLFLGMAEGLQPVFSYLSGADETERCNSLRRFSSRVFILFGLICYALVLLCSHRFYMIFSPEDLELLTFAQNKSIPYFCGFFLAGFNILMISFWQSTQQTRHSLITALSRSIVWPLFLTAVLPLILGKESIWLCLSLGELFTTITAIYLLKTSKNLKAKLMC